MTGGGRHDRESGNDGESGTDGESGNDGGKRRNDGESGNDGGKRRNDEERQFFPGNANLRIGIQANQEKDRHLDLSRKYVSGHTYSISPTHDAVISPHRRYVHLPASFLRRQES